MFRYFKALCIALVVLSLFESARARKTSFGRHSYPKSGGLSGSGGGHHYPSSGGLSGGSGSHHYPSSGGLSGGGHGYPSSSGSHGYPSSSGSHAYPSSGGGSHTYPGNSHGSSGGLSGSGSHGYPASKGNSGSGIGHSTNVHYHYHYSPPQKISYAPVHGGPPMSYPVYHGPPPTYVYKYKDSGSKYGTLLAGLALLNLGTLAGSVYANRHSSYKPHPNEICKFGIKKDNGDYQETKIDCQLITSFIFEEEAKANSGAHNATVTTTTVTNVTVVNVTNISPEGASSSPAPVHSFPLYMLPNDTLVPVNMTTVNVTAINNATNPNDNSSTQVNVMTSSVTSMTSTTNTTVTNALDVKGKPIDVTPGMKCYVIRNSPTSNMRRSVPCGLLQSYADQSIRRNSAPKHIPSITILSVVFAAILLY